jgi:hypothetical protein
MLLSDDLKTDDEHTVLGYINHYTKAVAANMKKNPLVAANLLTRCLRFNFLSFHNLISAVRKNEYLQMSEVFVDCF